MRVVMAVLIVKPGGGSRTVRKEVDLPFAPHAGMQVEFQGWGDTRKVNNVMLRIDGDGCEASLWIDMEKEKTDNAEEQERLVDRYRECGWSVVGE